MNHVGSGGRKQSSSFSVPPARVVCTFADGGVGLYNLQNRRWEFLREQVCPSDVYLGKVCNQLIWDMSVKLCDVIILLPL